MYIPPVQRVVMILTLEFVLHLRYDDVVIIINQSKSCLSASYSPGYFIIFPAEMICETEILSEYFSETFKNDTCFVLKTTVWQNSKPDVWAAFFRRITDITEFKWAPTHRYGGHATPTMPLKHYVKGREVPTRGAEAIDHLYSS